MGSTLNYGEGLLRDDRRLALCQSSVVKEDCSNVATDMSHIPNGYILPAVMGGPGLASRGHFVAKDGYEISLKMTNMSTDQG